MEIVDHPYEVWQTPLEPLEDSFEPERLILTDASFRKIKQLILALAAALSAPLAKLLPANKAKILFSL